MGVVMSGSNNISKLLLVSRGVFRVTGVGRDSNQSRAGRGDRLTNRRGTAEIQRERSLANFYGLSSPCNNSLNTILGY